jgi:hypothetical protein
VVYVGRDDGAPAGHLAADELGLEPLPESDELHLLCDLALPGVVHLGDSLPRLGAAHRSWRRQDDGIIRALTAEFLEKRLPYLFHIAARLDPSETMRRQAAFEIGNEPGLCVGTAGVVEIDGWVVAGEGDLLERYTHRRIGRGDVDLLDSRFIGALHRIVSRECLWQQESAAGWDGAASPVSGGSPFAGITQVRCERSTTAVALSARFPELP